MDIYHVPISIPSFKFFITNVWEQLNCASMPPVLSVMLHVALHFSWSDPSPNYIFSHRDFRSFHDNVSVYGPSAVVVFLAQLGCWPRLHCDVKLPWHPCQSSKDLDSTIGRKSCRSLHSWTIGKRKRIVTTVSVSRIPKPSYSNWTAFKRTKGTKCLYDTLVWN